VGHHSRRIDPERSAVACGHPDQVEHQLGVGGRPRALRRNAMGSKVLMLITRSPCSPVEITMRMRRNLSTCLCASRECSQKGRGGRRWFSRGHGTRQLVPVATGWRRRGGRFFWHGRCTCKRRAQ
jgi:hypothetical protein